MSGWAQQYSSQSKHTIDANFDAAISVFPVDLDGDGDMDIIGTAYTDYDVAWFENNGSQVFTERSIDGDFDGATVIYPVDIDGDGDMDIIGGAWNLGDIALYQNNGSQSFTKNII